MKPILTRLDKLKSILNKDPLDFNLIKSQIDLINGMETIDEYEYLNNLLYPETRKGVRIPTAYPIPTCTFQLTARNFLATTNNEVVLLYVNPWFLKSPLAQGVVAPYDYVFNQRPSHKEYFMKDFTTVLFSRANALDGENPLPPGTYLTPWKFDQEIPNVYDKYRLVSACLNIRYGRQLKNCRGVVGGGICLDKIGCIGAKYYEKTSPNETFDPNHDSYNAVLPVNKYGNFNLIRNLPYSCEYPLVAGLRMLYFPVSNSYEEFVPLFSGENFTLVNNVQSTYINPEVRIEEQYMKTGFSWLVYVQNGPKNYNRTIDVELCCNFECIPKPEYLSYFDVSTYKSCYSMITEEQKKKVHEYVKKNAIQKINKFNI